MGLFTSILLPCIIFPLVLSLWVWRYKQRYLILSRVWPFVWLPSYFWLIGFSIFPPGAAKDWLWLLLALSVLIGQLFDQKRSTIIWVATGLFTVFLVLITKPVLENELSVLLIVELGLVLFISHTGVVFLEQRSNSEHIPSRSSISSLAISCGGLGLTVALEGSLLVGQLILILATIFSVFMLLEFKDRFSNYLDPYSVIPLLQMYYALLVIALIYAELPLSLGVLFLVSPMVSLMSRLRYAWVYNSLTVLIPVAWQLFVTDSSSYY